MSRLRRLVPGNTLILVALRACAAPPQRPGETEPDPDCHAGPRLGHTGESTDVGTDGLWQVPGLLGIAQRLPLMHNGCATSLHARFEPSCGGTAHGDTAHLAPAELDDLVSYLESL